MKISTLLTLLTVVIAASGDRRIWYGEKMDPTDVPYHAVVLRRMLFDFHYFCGGSFVSKRIVLSAAHCIHSDSPVDYRIVGGDHYQDRQKSTRFHVKKVIRHQQYVQGEFDYDIAMFVLESLAKFPENIKFVTLPDKFQRPYDGDLMLITGYGVSENSRDSDVFRGAKVPVYGQTKCKRDYNLEISKRMICAGFEKGGSDACQGDSGGPMVGVKDKVLHGITSFGIGCGLPKKPGVYARVSQFIDWIESNMKNES